MASWEQCFGTEFKRLKEFYLIKVDQGDLKEIEEWLKDRLELGSADQIIDKLKNMPPIELQQLRYELIQSVKRIHRNKTSQANDKLQAIRTAHTVDEKETRDHRLE